MAVSNNLVLFDQHSDRNSPDGIVPDLATEWSWSDDRKTLTFKRADGVKWHDGKPFTSADVKCTWDTITEKRKAGWRKHQRKEWYFNMNEVTTNGERGATFYLDRQPPSLLSLLTGGISPGYPCHVSGRDRGSKSWEERRVGRE